MNRCYICQVDAEGLRTWTIDDLAAATCTTTRRIRSLQTLGLLPHPTLRGRTGLYGDLHRRRLEAVLRLQDQGFSLESLVMLFDALEAGRSLAAVLGTVWPAPAATGGVDHGSDSAELYGFTELQPAGVGRRQLLSVVPTTLWDESQAS
jgi:DNA-binding transcriptional MerR regulator